MARPITSKPQARLATVAGAKTRTDRLPFNASIKIFAYQRIAYFQIQSK